jgi:hypothetical protein
MFGIENQLWNAIRDPESGYLNEAGQLTLDSFNRFIRDQAQIVDNSRLLLTDGSTKATKGVALYTGNTNGIYNGNIANDFASRSGDEVVTLDRTRLGDLILAVVDGKVPGNIGLADDLLPRNRSDFDLAFDLASESLVRSNSEKLIVFASSDADANKVLGRIELPTAIEPESGYTSINGKNTEELRAEVVEAGLRLPTCSGCRCLSHG